MAKNKHARVIAASTATLIAFALAPAAAQAAGQNTIYVDNTNPACADSGTGTLDAPFCTLQAAADMVDPGDIVKVEPGTYASATVTRSGTASAPIRFVAAEGSDQSSILSFIDSLTLQGANDIVVSGFGLGDRVGTVTVDGGSDVTFTYDTVEGPLVAGTTALHITGAASDVTVRDSRLNSVLIDGASTGTMLTTNTVGADSASAVAIADATGTDVISNTIGGCGPAVSVTDASVDTRIENNLIGGVVTSASTGSACPAASTSYGLLVDSGSAASTVSDYNDVYSAGYDWKGTVYSEASSFYGATGQGQHDFNTAQSTTSAEGSPAIDSADSSAPGEQSTDFYGKQRVSDPTVAHTGAGTYDYYDRGAYEFLDPHTTTSGSTFTATATRAPVGSSITLHTNYGDTWSDSATYEYDITGPAGSSTITTTAADTSLALPTAGTYTIGLAVDYAGYGYLPTGISAVVNAVAAAPLVPALALTASGTRAVTAGPAATTGAWNVASVSYDFGDGTDPQTGAGTAAVSHTYAHVGTYTVTEKVTDAGGDTATTSSTFATSGSDYTAYGPTRILDTRKGVGATEAKVHAGGDVALKIAGNGSIPAGVTAVALNVTATDTVGNGYVSVEPDGTSAASSNLNYLAGQTQTNYVIVPVAADGKIDLYDLGPAGGSVDLIADVSGYFTQATGSGYTPVTPARILDTRHGTGVAAKQVGPSTGLSVGIAGADSIPTGVKAVAVHVTVTDTTGNGWIAAEADGAGTPTTSILNYLKGQTVSNTVIVPVASDGKIELYNGGGPGSVDLIADVAGYFSTSSTDAYIPLTPYRAWDSRTTGGKLAKDAAQSYALGDDETQTIPTDATLITNITLTDLTANGYVTAYPASASRPGISTLNYLKGQTVAGLSLLATSESDQLADVYNQSTGTGDIIFDVFGYFST